MIENWKIKVLEHCLVDYTAWATNAVDAGIFPDNNTALETKVIARLPHIIFEYESINGAFAEGLNDEEKTNIIVTQQDYMNRAERDAAELAALQSE